MRDWCSECQFANFGGSQEPCYNCVTAYNKKPSEFTHKNPVKPITNADHIRAMKDEEMANWIHQTRHNPLEDRTMSEWLNWLKQEATDDGT